MINSVKVNNFVELAKIYLPKNEVENFIQQKEREYRRESYFAHKNMYDSFVKEQAKRKAKETPAES